ncbi:transposase [Paenibacillus sp. CH40]|uniref:transposase n=1 Tax=Paenibacillus sp. CH40 TaxID=2962045 RepID=UPI00349F6A8D
MAVDSAAIPAYEKKQPKRKSELTGNANWGAKFDSFGNKVKWFGYKLHLAVDTASELPMVLSVTPAPVNDGGMAPALMERVAVDTKVKFFMLVHARYGCLFILQLWNGRQIRYEKRLSPLFRSTSRHEALEGTLQRKNERRTVRLSDESLFVRRLLAHLGHLEGDHSPISERHCIVGFCADD